MKEYEKKRKVCKNGNKNWKIIHENPLKMFLVRNKNKRKKHNQKEKMLINIKNVKNQNESKQRG